MADDVESKKFREHARRNGFAYGIRGKDKQPLLFIYKAMDTAVIEYSMPEYHSKGSVGAIEAFAGLLQNISEAMDSDPKAKMAKNLPGIDTPDGDFALTISLSGPMYLLDYKDCTAVMAALDQMAHQYGWETTRTQFAVTYKPNREAAPGGDLYCEDPVTAASRTMMVASMAHMRDAALVLTEAGDDSEYAKNIARLEKEGLGNTFGQAKEAFLGNTGATVVGQWRNAGYPVHATIEGRSVASSVNVVPSSLTVVPRAYVRDSASSEIYPTRLDISVTLQNPYGKLFRTNTERN